MPPTVSEETRRAATYKLLAECYYPPSEELMALLCDSELSTSQPIGELARLAAAVTDIQPLRVDHARLFVGPYGLLAPPYGSVYLNDSKLMGDSTLAVKAIYSREGLDVVLREAPDHISMELEFMYVLVAKGIGALAESDLPSAAAYRRKQASFLSEHLGRWVGALAAKLEEGAQSEFYKALGRLTGRFVKDDFEELLASERQSPTLAPSGRQ